MTDVLRFVPPVIRRIRLHCSPDWFEDLYELSWDSIEECLDRCGNIVLEFCEICKFEDQRKVEKRIEEKIPLRFRDSVRVRAWDLF